MNIVLRIALAIASILYPLLWYVGREQGWFTPLALLMVALWIARACWVKTRAERLIAILLAIFFAALLLWRQPLGMYWYPVIVNALMLALFGGSLFAKQSLIETLARLQEPDLPQEAILYTRRVTQIWCAFFVVNGSIAALLVICQAYDAWAVYTGIIAYVLMGILFAGEWWYRRKRLENQKI